MFHIDDVLFCGHSFLLGADSVTPSIVSFLYFVSGGGRLSFLSENFLFYDGWWQWGQVVVISADLLHCVYEIKQEP